MQGLARAIGGALAGLVLFATPAFGQATYDIDQLDPRVRAAAVQARAQRDAALNAAARAQRAQEAAERSGAVRPDNGYGVWHGQGQWLGDYYAGQWSNRARSGVGVYTFANNDSDEGSGLSYEGEWLDGRRNGVGVYRSRSGDRYEGQHLRGERAGHGVYQFASGAVYEGQYSGGRRNGYGVLWTADGQVRQSGFWTDGRLTTNLGR